MKIYKHQNSAMFFLKVLLLLVIMTMTTKLNKSFHLDSIMFTWTKHPFPCYQYFDQLMNTKYGGTTIEKNQLVASKIFTDNTHQTFHDDMTEI